MKKIILVAVFFLFAFTLVVQAQEKEKEFISPPDSVLYGVYQDGAIFIATKVVEAVEGSKPKVMFGPEWQKKEMKFSADKKFYYFRAEKKFSPFLKVEYCFDIGGRRFIPHALADLEDENIISLIKPNDILDNGIGGYNFRTKPLPIPDK